MSAMRPFMIPRARSPAHRGASWRSGEILPGLSVGIQCALPSISRASFYYEPKGESEMNLDPMGEIGKQFLETPFFCARQMTWHLRNDDHVVKKTKPNPISRGRE